MYTSMHSLPKAAVTVHACVSSITAHKCWIIMNLRVRPQCINLGAGNTVSNGKVPHPKAGW